MPNYTTLSALFIAIANAIRSKKGSSSPIVADNFPSEIASIPTASGVSGTIPISITNNGTTTHDVAAYANASVQVNVPNTYGSGDNGKVVSGGALVSQTAITLTANGTYDSTLNNSVTVNVPAGQGVSRIWTGTINTSAVAKNYTRNNAQVTAFHYVEFTTAGIGFTPDFICVIATDTPIVFTIWDSETYDAGSGGNYVGMAMLEQGSAISYDQCVNNGTYQIPVNGKGANATMRVICGKYNS